MKKAIIFSLAFALVAMPVMAGAVTTGSITTGLTPDTSGGTAPVVHVKWEANTDRWSDDVMAPNSNSAGAQFNPTGVKDLIK